VVVDGEGVVRRALGGSDPWVSNGCELVRMYNRKGEGWKGDLMER
jgi:hypothetical protein